MNKAIKKRTCICCGKAYTYCGNCPADKHLETWHALYCSDNCHDIFEAANDYNFDLLTKEEAKKQIEACDLSNLESFNKIVKADVHKIIDDEKKHADHTFAKKVDFTTKA